ncbi:HNH endonuclease [Lactococcus phage 936 group phage PhiE1127]|uniref:HNH endonuclease n=1 Tax=Lactococcus phage 936 group phage PhiE1127 TaxID=1636576 RepID=A0A126HDE2_9CAUD|nr:HNH endonuclease [Lactococcus phage 936 group phage PhiE1127]ALM64610.1 HNH endonuclease [Lactococcus phage 936 group phage PhiE1127]
MSVVETFVKIEGFNNYEVSNLGKIRNIKSGRTLKPYLDNNGYLMHCLSENNKRKNLLLHRVLAIAFIDNPEEKPCVNHIDENKLNNDLSNLEWCSVRENNVHGTRMKRIAEKRFKKVIQLDLNDNVLNVFESIKQAGQETGVFATSISACCNGRIKSSGGFKWKRK